MPIEYKKVAGFISIGLIVLELGISALVYFVIPEDLFTLRETLLLVGGYLGVTGALWPVLFSTPDEYGDQIIGFKRVLLLIATLALLAVAVVGFMLPHMYVSSHDSGNSTNIPFLILMILALVHALFGVVSLFFLEGNKVQFYHPFFEFIPHSGILFALWILSPIVLPLCLLSWIIGWGHTFFFESLPLWKIIAFFVCLASLVVGLIFYFRPMGDNELDRDLKFISLILFYIASCFPGVLQFGDERWEDNGFFWVLFTIIPLMIATFVAAVFAINDYLFVDNAEYSSAMKTFFGLYCFGSMLAFLGMPLIKFTQSWPIPVKVALCVITAPIWAVFGIIHDTIVLIRRAGS